MDGGHYVGRKSGFNELAALFSDAKLWTEQSLSCGGAKRDNHLRLDERDLGFEPGTASRNFRGVRFFVDAAFATRFPLEMFDDIGDVSLRTINAGFCERVVKQSAGGTDEGFALEILFVAWLLADKHDDGATASFAEDSLGA